MSELDSKLEAPAQSQGGKARATLKQLFNMWGFQPAVDGDVSKPSVVYIDVMGNRHSWRRLSSGDYERES